MLVFNCINICSCILLFSFITSVLSRAIHEDMTMGERAQAFDTTENLPKYELLPIHYTHVNRRAVNGPVSLELKPFGDHIKLWLEPADGVLFSDETPIYSVYTNTDGLDYLPWTDELKTLRPYLYSDYKSYTTLAVNPDGNRVRRMAGVIGSKDLVIRPVPTRLAADVTRYRRSTDKIPESNQDDHHYHIVYKRAINQTVQPLKNSLKLRRLSQDTVYPEILVIADHNLFQAFDGSRVNMILYLMAFWNGVDMMYRTLEHPKYRLHISAIIIAEEEEALQYLSSNKVGLDKLEYLTALNDSRSWLFEYLPQNIDVYSYDVAATMTTLKLCNMNDQGECELGPLGVAYPSGTCQVSRRHRTLAKTVILHDHGAFTGIHTAGHELGHSFGAHHDGEKLNTRCANENGNVMSTQTNMTNTMFDWSECTLDEFGTFLGKGGSCLYNKPESGTNLVRLLPGKLENADKQCELIGKKKAWRLNASICITLWCVQHDNPRIIIAKGPAADGTPCGDGAMCLHGKCILESMVTY